MQTITEPLASYQLIISEFTCPNMLIPYSKP